MAPGKAESDFGLQAWIDTLGLKQIFLIFSAYPELREVKLVTLKMFFSSFFPRTETSECTVRT